MTYTIPIDNGDAVKNAEADSQRTLYPYVTGTSIVAIKYKDGVSMASDMRGVYPVTPPEPAVGGYEGGGDVEKSNHFGKLQDLIEQYESKELRLESLTAKQKQAMGAFMGSYDRFRVVQDKAIQLRNLLGETESEMAACEAETLELGAASREADAEMADSQQMLQATAECLGLFLALSGTDCREC